MDDCDDGLFPFALCQVLPVLLPVQVDLTHPILTGTVVSFFLLYPKYLVLYKEKRLIYLTIFKV